MKRAKELRAEAWDILVHSLWGWRVFACYLAQVAILVVVVIEMLLIYQSLGIQTWDEYHEMAKAAKASGLDLDVPSLREWWNMTLASSFQTYVQCLLSGIFSFGLATVLLKCLKDDCSKWFSSMFGGFLRPWAMFWLFVLMALRIFLWSLLLIIPGIVAVFRYALAWYIKAEDPELSAGACLRRSGELMEGKKWRLFCFSISYFGWVLPGLAMMIVAAEHEAVSGLLILLTWSYLLFVGVYMMIGHACFYRAAKAEEVHA